MHQKAQSSFEFLLLVGIVFFAAMMLIGVSYTNIVKLQGKRDFFAVKDLALVVQNELVLAAQVEDGYSRSFFLPDDIDGSPYSITISGNSITLSTEKATYSSRIPQVQGSLAKGMNNITKQDNLVVLNG